MAEFHHFGVPTTVVQENEMYSEDMKLYLTDPEKHPLRIEYLRFQEGATMPADIQNIPHIAYKVDDIDVAIAGKKVLLPPTAISDELQIAFVNIDGAVIEFMAPVK
ncbi:MAG: hypothetical protein JEZ07_03525 [Phycisphaerae bacterium]|nr:hypothetical protein [Phycisphaerae bacterium]